MRAPPTLDAFLRFLLLCGPFKAKTMSLKRHRTAEKAHIEPRKNTQMLYPDLAGVAKLDVVADSAVGNHYVMSSRRGAGGASVGDDDRAFYADAGIASRLIRGADSTRFYL
ncbi:hypothetical protein C8R45DRAFT_927880 [Mycena sanguinolenta]|nr:hypothetical protein C8R45DRAFT_927880 [Mycena sanguinolenta]